MPPVDVKASLDLLASVEEGALCLVLNENNIYKFSGTTWENINNLVDATRDGMFSKKDYVDFIQKFPTFKTIAPTKYINRESTIDESFWSGNNIIDLQKRTELPTTSEVTLLGNIINLQFSDNKDIGLFGQNSIGIGFELTGKSNSILLGKNIISDFENVIALGSDLLISDDNVIIFGKFNVGDGNNKLEIGDGTSEGDRSNILSLSNDGILNLLLGYKTSDDKFSVQNGLVKSNIDVAEIISADEKTLINKEYLHKYIGFIEIEGKVFQWCKKATNTGNVPDVGDIAINGFNLDDEFITAMVMTGSNPELFASWSVLSSNDPIRYDFTDELTVRINHNMNKYPTVTIYKNSVGGGHELSFSTVIFPDNDNFEVTFNESTTGFIIYK